MFNLSEIKKWLTTLFCNHEWRLVSVSYTDGSALHECTKCGSTSVENFL
jgi:transcription elongation factor Elf1